MPNRHYGELNDEQRERFDRAAEYLAEKLAEGEVDWRPTKPLDEYSYEEITRKAHKFEQLERAGLPLDNDIARGKHPDEHPTLQAPRAAYDIAAQVEGARFTEATQGGRWVAEFTTDAVLERLADTAPGTTLSIAYEGKDGEWHTIHAHGTKIETLLRYLEEEDTNFEEWLVDESDDVYGDGSEAGYAGGNFKIVTITR